VTSPVLPLKGKESDKKAVNLSRWLTSYLGIDKMGKVVRLTKILKLMEDTTLVDELYAQLLQLSDELRTTFTQEGQSLAFCDFLIRATFCWVPTIPDIVVAVRRLLASWARGPILKLSEVWTRRYQRRMEFAYIRFDSILLMKKVPPFAHADPRTSWKTSEALQIGVSLYECMWKQRRSHPSVPIPMLMLMLEKAIIDKKARETEGIFRKVGNIRHVEETVIKINRGDKNWTDGLLVHDLGSLYKLWIRNVPGNIVDVQKSQRIFNNEDPLQLVNELTPLNRNVLMHVVGFLKDLATFEPVTKMGVSNLALVLGLSICASPPTDNPIVIQDFPLHTKAFLEKLINEWDVSAMYPIVPPEW
jgi:hypothetical protein